MACASRREAEFDGGCGFEVSPARRALAASFDRTWAQVRASLAASTRKPLEIDEHAHRIVAEIDDAQLWVDLTARDSGTTDVSVRARKYMIDNGQIAREVLDALVADLERER